MFKRILSWAIFVFLVSLICFGAFGCYLSASREEAAARIAYEEALKREQAKPKERVRVLDVSNERTSRPQSGIKIINNKPIESTRKIN